MAYAEVMGKKVYYEVHGEGEPLIILNGIMMSTLSWASFIKTFSKNYQLILMDFIDQGQSEKVEEEYSQEYQVDILEGLIDHLELDKVHLVGVSYGGEIAQRFALRSQEKISSLILANTTSYTNKILQDIGKGWIYSAKTYDGRILFNVMMPYVYSMEFYEENYQWLKDREEVFAKYLPKEWYEGFIRLTKSAEDLNITDRLKEINIPTLIIGAEFDITTPLRLQKKIQKRIPNSKLVVIEGSGHASMYEKPYEFAALILGFLESYKDEIKIL